MGNNVSSGQESPPSSEDSPPAKRWTAAQGRAEGFGSVDCANSKPEDRDPSSTPKTPRRRKISALPKTPTPTGHNPRSRPHYVNDKENKIPQTSHRDCSGEWSDDTLPSVEQLISRSASKRGMKRTGLACMGCLSNMNPTIRKSFAGCHNQPGRSDDAPCQVCKDSHKACRQPPTHLKELAWELQMSWENRRMDDVDRLCSAWDQYSRGLQDYGGLATSASSSTTTGYPSWAAQQSDSTHPRAPKRPRRRASTNSEPEHLQPALVEILKGDRSEDRSPKPKLPEHSDDEPSSSQESQEELAALMKLADAYAESDDDFTPGSTSDSSESEETEDAKHRNTTSKRVGSARKGASNGKK